MGSAPGSDFPVSVRLPSAEAVMPLYRQLCLGLLAQLLTHEFNNALTSLSGYAQMGLSIKREDILLKAAQIVLDVSNRLQDLIQHIHTLSRESLSEIQPCDPAQPALLVQKILDHHLQKRNIELQLANRLTHATLGNSTVLALGMLTYVLDARDRLLQEGRGGIIWLRLEEDPDCIQIEMSDSALQPCGLLADVPGPDQELKPGVDPRYALAPLALRSVANIHSGTLDSRPTETGNVLIIRIPHPPGPRAPNS
jgi:hypothetical protein